MDDCGSGEGGRDRWRQTKAEWAGMTDGAKAALRKERSSRPSGPE